MNTTQALQAIAEPNRRKILALLTKRNLSVGQLAKHFVISLPSLSHHLSILKQANLVSCQRQGQEIFYAVNRSATKQVVLYLTKLLKK